MAEGRGATVEGGRQGRVEGGGWLLLVVSEVNESTHEEVGFVDAALVEEGWRCSG